MLKVNPYADHVVARVIDFVDPSTRWERRLWCVGVPLVLREILECAPAVERGVLSQSALEFLCDEALQLIRIDPACATIFRVLAPQLARSKKPLSPGGFAYQMLSQILAHLEPTYLKNWSVILDAPKPVVQPERAARAVTAHMLDCDFHPEYLHAWWMQRLRDPQEYSLGELVATLSNLAASPRVEFEVLVPFRVPPPSTCPLPPSWLEPKKAVKWLRANAPNSRVRHRGAMLFRQTARDAWSAVERVGEIVEQLSARIALGTGQVPYTCGQAWVTGHSGSFQLSRRRRGVKIGALERTGKLYERVETNVVDAAIELAAPLDEGPPGPALAGGWSAVEALLGGAGDEAKVFAGDRLAALIACSFPRAELTRLAYSHAALANDELAKEIRAVKTNREKAKLVANALAAKRHLTLRGSDQYALVRLENLMSNPTTGLEDIETHARAVLRRFYRQRNLVLHGGIIESVALRASLRTASPLIGAGLDRLVHAWFVSKTPPLELAAKARLRIALAGTAQAKDLVDLLE